MHSNQDIFEEEIDSGSSEYSVESQGKRRKIVANIYASSDTNTSTSSTRSESSDSEERTTASTNGLDLDLPIFDQIRSNSFSINIDDCKQILSTYNTLKSLNIFDLDIPIDILQIISQHAVGTVVLCPICKDTETLIAFHDLETELCCGCYACDNYNGILVCCLKKRINQKRCFACNCVYCIQCYNNQQCVQKCLACDRQFCDPNISEFDCGIRCSVTRDPYCWECRDCLPQCDFCGRYATNISSLKCACCKRDSRSCSTCEYKLLANGRCSCIACGEYTCHDCIRQCQCCVYATFCQRCMEEEHKKCNDCGDPCCDDCYGECSIEGCDKRCKSYANKCNRSTCEN